MQKRHRKTLNYKLKKTFRESITIVILIIKLRRLIFLYNLCLHFKHQLVPQLLAFSQVPILFTSTLEQNKHINYQDYKSYLNLNHVKSKQLITFAGFLITSEQLCFQLYSAKNILNVHLRCF